MIFLSTPPSPYTNWAQKTFIRSKLLNGSLSKTLLNIPIPVKPTIISAYYFFQFYVQVCSFKVLRNSNRNFVLIQRARNVESYFVPCHPSRPSPFIYHIWSWLKPFMVATLGQDWRGRRWVVVVDRLHDPCWFNDDLSDMLRNYIQEDWDHHFAILEQGLQPSWGKFFLIA